MPVLLCTCKHFSIPFHKFLAPFGLWKFVNVYTSFVYFCFFHFSCLLLFGFERIYKVNTYKKKIFFNRFPQKSYRFMNLSIKCCLNIWLQQNFSFIFRFWHALFIPLAVAQLLRISHFNGILCSFATHLCC